MEKYEEKEKLNYSNLITQVGAQQIILQALLSTYSPGDLAALHKRILDVMDVIEKKMNDENMTTSSNIRRVVDKIIISSLNEHSDYFTAYGHSQSH